MQLFDTDFQMYLERLPGRTKAQVKSFYYNQLTRPDRGKKSKKRDLMGTLSSLMDVNKK